MKKRVKTKKKNINTNLLFSTKLKTLLSKDMIYPFIIFIMTFTIYLPNISSSVFGGDSGDFLSAIVSKGVPHPSGYPLYTLIGIFFNYLPVGHTSAWRIGLSSALFASLTTVFVYMISNEIVKKKWISMIVSLTFATLYPFWIYAEVVEVFSLHCLFISLITYITFKYLSKPNNKYIYGLAFICGLSLTNNMTILLLFPAVFFVIITTDIKIIKNIRLIIGCFLLFLLGLLPYLYIPIAASYNPAINWDRAVNLKNFLNLVLRRDYGWAAGKNTDPGVFINSMKGIFVYWSEFLPILIPVLSLLGSIKLIIDKKFRILFFLLISMLLFGFIFIIYAKTPTNSIINLAALERFYIPPILFIILISSEGINLIVEKLLLLIRNRSHHSFFIFVTLLIFSLLPFFQYIRNRKITNLSNIYIGNNLSKDILRPLEPNSFLFVNNDEYGFNTVYIQLEEKFRTDITIPGRNTGFEKFLTVSRLKTDGGVQQYLINRQNSVDQAELYGGIMSLLDRGINVYSTVPKIVNDDQIGEFLTIPSGLVYKFVKVGSELPTKEEYLKQQEEIWNGFHLRDFDNYNNIVSYSMTLSTIKSHYAQAYLKIGNFIRYHYKDEVLFSRYYKKAVEFDPVYSSFQQ